MAAARSAYATLAAGTWVDKTHPDREQDESRIALTVHPRIISDFFPWLSAPRLLNAHAHRSPALLSPSLLGRPFWRCAFSADVTR